MKMPGHEAAIVPAGKVTDYLLSPSHPRGAMKAKWFAALGFSPRKPVELERVLLDLATTEFQSATDTEYGTKYVISGVIRGTNGQSAKLVSIWIVRTQDDAPRLVTAYPGK